MPLIVPTDPNHPEHRRQQVRRQVEQTLAEVHGHVRRAFEQLATYFAPGGGSAGVTSSGLTVEEAYRSLGDDAEELQKLRRLMRDFLETASPGSGTLPESQRRLAFGDDDAPEAGEKAGEKDPRATSAKSHGHARGGKKAHADEKPADDSK